jgi:hypothetical protein
MLFSSNVPALAVCQVVGQPAVQAIVQGIETEHKDMFIGRIMGNHEASEIIRTYLVNNPQVELDGWKWNGQWVTMENGFSYAGMSRDKHN